MSRLGLEHFRPVSSRAHQLDQRVTLNARRDGVQTDRASLAARIRGWLRAAAPPEHQQQQNLDAKQAFVHALTQAEGSVTATRALTAAGLPDAWLEDAQPLMSRTIAKVLDHAGRYHRVAIQHNYRLIHEAITQQASQLHMQHGISLSGSTLRTILHDAYAQPDVAQRTLASEQARTLADRAWSRHLGRREALCAERMPHLTAYARTLIPTPLLDPATLPFAFANDEDANIRLALTHLAGSTVLLGETAWSVPGMEAARQELADFRGTLQRTRAALPDGPRAPALAHALSDDLDHQLTLVDAKLDMWQQMIHNHPFSALAQAQHRMLTASTCEILLRGLVQEPEMRAIIGPRLCQQWQATWQGVLAREEQGLQQAAQDRITHLPAPQRRRDTRHPLIADQHAIEQAFAGMLRQPGERSAGRQRQLDARLDALLARPNLEQARRQALAESPDWLPVRTTLLVQRDGAIAHFTSRITPAHHLPLLRTAPGATPCPLTTGVPAPADDNPAHARNLKVSELRDNQGVQVFSVVGHGVLDMWGIRDPDQRAAANQRGAREVLLAALAGNERLEALTHSPRTEPLRITHVSVNLASAEDLRALLGLQAHEERTYIRNQFAAFEAVRGLHTLQPDPARPEHEITVDFQPITLSFGNDALAHSTLLGLWRDVEAHNTANLIRLVGDLGHDSGPRGTRIGTVGNPPGGFIGLVHACLLAQQDSHDEAERLLLQLRQQTDRVRTLYINDAHRSTTHDPSSMAREVLALQATAEQALRALGTPEAGATLSKGCKNDKDRGSLTDVELKTHFLLQHLGGALGSEPALSGDDATLYHLVSANSGQFETQRASTGLAGSTEACHLGARINDIQVRTYLAGMGKFTAH